MPSKTGKFHCSTPLSKGAGGSLRWQAIWTLYFSAVGMMPCRKYLLIPMQQQQQRQEAWGGERSRAQPKSGDSVPVAAPSYVTKWWGRQHLAR
eukprot:COSAG01_NODE_29694_length_632_cov_0.741088_1_plen_92_part_10